MFSLFLAYYFTMIFHDYDYVENFLRRWWGLHARNFCDDFKEFRCNVLISLITIFLWGINYYLSITWDDLRMWCSVMCLLWLFIWEIFILGKRGVTFELASRWKGSKILFGAKNIKIRCKNSNAVKVSRHKPKSEAWHSPCHHWHDRARLLAPFCCFSRVVARPVLPVARPVLPVARPCQVPSCFF